MERQVCPNQCCGPRQTALSFQKPNWWLTACIVFEILLAFLGNFASQDVNVCLRNCCGSFGEICGDCNVPL